MDRQLEERVRVVEAYREEQGAEGERVMRRDSDSDTDRSFDDEETSKKELNMNTEQKEQGDDDTV